jgi:heptosyltransferase I
VGNAGGGSHGVEWTPTPLLPREPRSILIIMMSAVGDAVQVLPVATALRRTFPGCHLAWVLQPGPHNLVQHHPAIDDFVLFPRTRRGMDPRSIPEGVRSLWSAARALRKLATRRLDGGFDLLLDLQIYLKAGLLTALAPARVKLGFDRARARDLNCLFTTHRIPPHPLRFGHIQDQYFEFLTSIGVDPEPVEFGLALTETEKEEQRRFFDTLDGSACAMVVGTSNKKKNWTAKGYAEVAEALRADFGLQPVLVGGLSKTDQAIAEEILTRTRGRVVDARGGDLRRLLWLLDGSALVISPDTGPMHMTRALGVPVVSLFGFTNPKRSGPYRRFTDLIVDGYSSFAGEDYGASMDRRPEGMARVTSTMVLEKVEFALDRYVGGYGLGGTRMEGGRTTPTDPGSK